MMWYKLHWIDQKWKLDDGIKLWKEDEDGTPMLLEGCPNVIFQKEKLWKAS